MWKALVIFGFLLVACYAIPGGFEEVDVDDEGVVTAANEATREISKNFFSRYHHRLQKVVKAKRQVVAGMNYEMDIIVGVTTCRKDEVDFEDCDFQDNMRTYMKCTVRVYRDLKNTHRLTSYGCSYGDAPRQ